MNQEKIGKFILELRKEKGMTQQELANKIGVTDRAISKWENGRGMPDLSLMKPLCNELGITINELISGEKIAKKDYQNKFEENILNTIDYSHKKIKHIKLIFKAFIIMIIFSLMALSILFIIDINRMRNNEPVFFSTWGFKYAPPLNIDDINIENAIKDYLIAEDELNNHYENKKSFVAMHTYLISEDLNNKYYVYAWVLQEVYYEKDGNVVKDTGTSIPYKFELVKIDDKFVVNNYNIPRDGSYYVKDMKHIFPNSVLKDMDSIHIDGTIEKLSLEIQNEVNLYFNK